MFFEARDPYISPTLMKSYRARTDKDAKRFGKIVKATELSNREYWHRYNRLSGEQRMQPPPSSEIHIVLGHLVVRQYGMRGQYETWMPSEVFEELYARDTETAG